MGYPLGVIPAVRRMKDFEKSLKAKSEWIIILETRLSQINHLVEYSRRANKKILVHFDLIKGLKPDEYALEYLIREVKPDGILSTKGNIIDIAKKNKLLTIQRIFLLDSLAEEHNLKQIKRYQPDYIELLPGLMPSAIKKMQSSTDIPIIAGGLITTEDEIKSALLAGAVGVSTSDPNLWDM